jgi:hypothetical protein
MAEYDNNPAHAFKQMLDLANGLAPGDPARMAAAIIASADVDPAPMRIMLGSQALANTLKVLKARITAFEAQSELAASTDFPPGR